jgi:hypothetical protein
MIKGKGSDLKGKYIFIQFFVKKSQKFDPNFKECNYKVPNNLILLVVKFENFKLFSESILNSMREGLDA